MLYTGHSGFLYEKLRNKSRNVNSDENQNEIVFNTERERESHEFLIDAEAADELMQFFRNCVVSQNKEEIIEKLKYSVEFRRSILQNPPEPIFKIFGFYFVDPELVIWKKKPQNYAFSMCVFFIFFRFCETLNLCLLTSTQML